MKQVKIILVIAILVLMNSTCSDNHLTTWETEPEEVSLSIDSIYLTKDSISNTEDLMPKIIGKYVYLTIDDGPLNGAVYIDSIVNKEQVKTNLFIVGNPIHGSGRFKKYLEMFQENSHIEIYNHSYTHANNKYTAFYKDPNSVLSDFEKNQIDFNITHKIARLPGRNLWLVGDRKKNMKQTGATSAELLALNGYEIYGWDVEWKYNHKDYVPEQTIDELIAEIDKAYNSNRTFMPEHVVLLMHDQMFAKKNDKNDLAELISKLKEKGYIFEYLSAYPKKN